MAKGKDTATTAIPHVVAHLTRAGGTDDIWSISRSLGGYVDDWRDVLTVALTQGLVTKNGGERFTLTDKGRKVQGEDRA